MLNLDLADAAIRHEIGTGHVGALARAQDLMTEVRKQNEAAIKERLLVAAESRRVVEGYQCGRLHSLSFIVARRPVHPGSKWLEQGRT